MAKKKKEKKESVSEIMEQIIDKDALAKRKAMAVQATNKHQPTKRKLIKITFYSINISSPKPIC